ncbi:hypothetical protein DFH09DRAFT_1408419 [Mycena vulgaris]|nr:hypothetical protein DFH09DRAFT_1408419 [Mycena vulgaris]
MAPVFNSTQTALAANLRLRLDAEIEARKEKENASSPSSAPDGDVDASGGTVRSRSDMEDDDDEFAIRLMDDASSPYTLEQGRAYKRHKKLSAQSDAEADFFLKTTNPMRHLFQMIVVGLECRDTLQIIKTDQDKKYKLTDTLSRTCQDYAHVALLSHKAKSYRNLKDTPTMASTIVGAMRTLGVADMPPSMETGRCEVLNKCIGKALTDKRYHIKQQIFPTLVDGSDKVDIATLTRACIGTSPVKPTAGMYQRVAFMRSVALQYKLEGGSATGKPADDAKDDFWPVVDAQLMVLGALSAEERQILFDMTYRDDLKIYSPVNKALPITATKDLDAWLVTINSAMEV